MLQPFALHPMCFYCWSVLTAPTPSPFVTMHWDRRLGVLRTPLQLLHRVSSQLAPGTYGSGSLSSAHQHPLSPQGVGSGASAQVSEAESSGSAPNFRSRFAGSVLRLLRRFSEGSGSEAGAAAGSAVAGGAVHGEGAARRSGPHPRGSGPQAADGNAGAGAAIAGDGGHTQAGQQQQQQYPATGGAAGSDGHGHGRSGGPALDRVQTMQGAERGASVW